MNDFILSAFADEAGESLAAQIAALKRNGLSHVEIRGVDGRPVIDWPEDKLRQIADTLKQNGVVVSSLGSPIGKIGILEDFEPHFERFKQAVQAAKILGTDRIRMFSFFIPQGEDPAQYEAEVVRRVNALCAYAGENGIFCCHENEKEIYGDTVDRVLRLYERCPGLKGVFDPANFIQCGEDPAAGFERLKGNTDYLHIKDAVKADGSVVPAGEGDGGLPGIIEEFYQPGSGRVLSVEPHLFHFGGLSQLQKEELKGQKGYEDGDAAFDAAVKALKALLDEKGYCYE